MKRFKAIIFLKSGQKVAIPIWGKDATTALQKYTRFEKDKDTNKFTSSVLIEGEKTTAYFLVGSAIEFIDVREYNKEATND